MPPLIARDTAHRLVAREQAAPDGPADVVAAAERALRERGDGRGGWFGPLGAHALVTRALAQARAEHPALARVSLAGTSAHLDGLDESRRAHGEDAAAAAAVDLLATLIDLLGRLIGDALATTLVEQSGRAGGAGHGMHDAPRAGGAPEAEGAGGTGGANSDTTGSLTDD